MDFLKNKKIKYTIIFFLLYMLNAMTYIMFPVILKDYFSIEEISIILGSGAVGTLFVLYLNTSEFFNKHLNVNNNLIIVTISSFLYLLFSNIIYPNFYILLISFMLFQSSFLKQIQLLEVDILSESLDYSWFKSFGTIGFSTAILITILFDINYINFLLIFIPLLCILLISIITISSNKVKPKKSKQFFFKLTELYNFVKTEILLFIFIILMIFQNSANALYFGIYLKELNFSEVQISSTWLISLLFSFLAEFYIYNKIKNKFPLIKIIIFTSLFTSLRFILYMFLVPGNINLVYIVASGHFFTWGMLHLSIMDYIKNKFKNDLLHLKETIQIYSFLRYGIIPILISLIAGIIIPISFNIFWFITAITSLIALYFMFKIENRKIK